MSGSFNEWVCWCKIDSLGGRPKPETIRNPHTGKMEKTGKMIGATRASDNVSYINRRGETIGAGCNLPSLGEDFCEVYGMPFSVGDRSRITRRFVGIEKEERAVRWDSRTGYSVKMPVPNTISPEHIPELAHDIARLVLYGNHEYCFSVHRGGISAKNRAAMDEKERDPITGQMRLTPHARALRGAIRGEDNRHIHFIFRERPIGEKSKDSVRWMQTKIHGVMCLRSCPADPDGEREHYGFDDALGEILTNTFGFTILKKTYIDTRPRVHQKKFKAAQKQKIRDIERAEIHKDMAEIVQNYRRDYQRAESQKVGITERINDLDRALEIPARKDHKNHERLPEKLQTGQKKSAAIVEKTAELAKAKQTHEQKNTQHTGYGGAPGRDR